MKPNAVQVKQFFASHWPLLVLLAGAGFLFLWRIGSLPLADYDEATYAQVTLHSFAKHSYGSLMRFNQQWFEKPPLYFWLAAATTKLFGFHEFALRLPAALSGWVAVVLVWAFVKRQLRSQWPAFFAGLIVLLTGEFLYAAQQIRMDVPVAACIFAAVYFFVAGWDQKEYYLLSGLFLAAGVLFKNVVGLFALPLFLVFALVYRRWKWLGEAYFWWGMLCACALIVPWHLYESIKFGSEFWQAYFGYHILRRFAEPILGGQITVRHYFKYLWLFAEPWYVVFYVCCLWLVSRLWRQMVTPEVRLALASFTSAVILFVIYSVAKTKLFYYLEPVYPFMAAGIAACGWGWYRSLTRVWQKNTFNVFIVLLLFVALGSAIWQKVMLRQGVSDDYAIAGEEKAVGLLVKDSPYPVYVFGWTWTETLLYYADKSVSPLPASGSPEHYFLIVPAELFRTYTPSADFVSHSQSRYAGGFVELYEVAPQKTAP